MSDLDPIELGIAINSEELMKEFRRMVTSSQDLDKSLLNTKKSFNDFVQSQLTGNGALSDNAKLTNAQTDAIKRHAEALLDLKEKSAATFDPEQLSLYAHQIKIAEAAIQKIIESANANAVVMDVDAIDQANDKLVEAGKLIDEINDKTFTPDFASPEELEVLSDHINQANDEFDQLGVLLDFILNKIENIDPNSDAFIELTNEIAKVNEMLGGVEEFTPALNEINKAISEVSGAPLEVTGRFDELLQIISELEQAMALTDEPAAIQHLQNQIDGVNQLINDFGNATTLSQQLKVAFAALFSNLTSLSPATEEFTEQFDDLYDVAGKTLEELQTALKAFKDELVAEVDTQAIVEINRNIELLEKSIIDVKNAGKNGFDEFGNKLNSQKYASLSLQTELQKLVQDMAKLRLSNQQNSQEYQELRDRAIEVRSALAGINQEVNSNASSTTGFDNLIRATSAITAGFSIAQGAAALFGTESENVEKTIAKVTSTMAILQGLQQIQVELKRQDSIVTNAQSAAQKLYSVAVGSSTGVLKLFRIALASTGIGLIIILIASLIANWDKITSSIKNSLPALDGFSDKLNDLKAYVMGFLNAYLSLYETLWTSLIQLVQFDFKGALESFSGIADNAVGAFNQGLADSYASDAEAARNKELEKDKAALERLIQIREAGGKETNDLHKKVFAINAELYRKDQEKAQENAQDRAVHEATYQKKITDEQKKAAEKRNQLAEAARKKSIEQAKRLAEEQKKVIQSIAEASRNIDKQVLSNADRQIEDIKDKYQNLKGEAKKASLGNKYIMQIEVLEKKEISNETYKQGTDSLIKALEEEKELFKAYEELKTRIGADEYVKQNEAKLKGFLTFTERIQVEIDKLTQKPDNKLSELEKVRLKELEALKSKEEKDLEKEEKDKYLKAYEAVLSYNEKLKLIDKEYLSIKKELEKVTDQEIRDAKLGELDRQRKENIDSVNREANDVLMIWQNLSSNLVGITKRELDIRIASIEHYISLSKNLTEDQKTFLESELKLAKAVRGRSDLQVREKTLLQQKKRILEQITILQAKDNQLLAEQLGLLELVNQDLANLEVEKLAKHFGDASLILGSMSSALADSNEELSQMLGLAAEMANDAASIISAFQKGVADGIVAAVATAIKYVGKLFSMRKAARESERKAREELKKYQQEIIVAGLEYNKMLRDRVLIEAKINDLYVSRVQNIREEMEALKKNKDSIIQEQNDAWARLLGQETITGKSTKKKGGFLGMGKKTVVVNHTSTVAQLLGIKEGTELTDELFEKLEKLNSQKPLTGDAKEAYEQLKKLRDEYGSIESALAQLDIDLKNAVTGNTAQSIADSIAEGIKSGKRSFADFADDIEGFLRDAILAGMSAKILEPEMQKLQDLLYEMMGDGVLTEEERQQWQEMYLKLAQDAQGYMDMMNQAGINMSGSMNSANSLKGALEGMTAEQADLLAGQFGGLRLTQLETNQILKNGAAQQLAQTSRMVESLARIEENTGRTANYAEVTTSELVAIKNLLIKFASADGKRGAGL